jgi:hypothetical protein
MKKKSACRLVMKHGQPSFYHYFKDNENVVGTNWDKVNKDREQVGLKPYEKETQYN